MTDTNMRSEFREWSLRRLEMSMSVPTSVLLDLRYVTEDQLFLVVHAYESPEYTFRVRERDGGNAEFLEGWNSEHDLNNVMYREWARRMPNLAPIQNILDASVRLYQAIVLNMNDMFVLSERSLFNTTTGGKIYHRDLLRKTYERYSNRVSILGKYTIELDIIKRDRPYRFNIIFGTTNLICPQVCLIFPRIFTDDVSYVRASGLVVDNGLTPATWNPNTEDIVPVLDNVLNVHHKLLEGKNYYELAARDYSSLSHHLVGVRVRISVASGNRQTAIVPKKYYRDSTSGEYIHIMNTEGLRTACRIEDVEGDNVIISSLVAKNLFVRDGDYVYISSLLDIKLPRISKMSIRMDNEHIFDAEHVRISDCFSLGDEFGGGGTIMEILNSKGEGVNLGIVGLHTIIKH